MLRGVEDGRYDTIVDTFEILGAIGGAYGVEPGDPNPQANALLQLLCDRADFPGSICGLARALAAAPLQQQIDMNIEEETKNTLLILGDLYRNIDTFNVYGEIEIAASYPNEDGFLRGNTSRWHGLRFFWQTDCPFASTNPADCSREVPFDDVGGSGETPFSATFDAQYDAPTDVLLISRHTMGISYGTFLLIALERWIFPATVPQADADNVEIAEFLGLSDCATIDQSLVPICEEGFSLLATS